MKRLAFISLLMLGSLSSIAHAQVGTTKAGVVYCNNNTGYQASCAMYYYSKPERTPIRGEAIIGNQNIINIDIKGPSAVTINTNGRRAPGVTYVQQNIGRGATLSTGTMQWTQTGSGYHCATPTFTCTLKEEAVLDTGCSCGTKKGRVRGVVVP